MQNQNETTFIVELYKFLVLSLNVVSIIELNTLYDGIKSIYKKINDSTVILVSDDIYIYEYLLYLESDETFLVKKKGIKAFFYRLLGGLTDSLKLYQKGLDNRLVSTLSQIKLERRIFNLNAVNDILLYCYYSKKLNLFVLYREVKLKNKG